MVVALVFVGVDRRGEGRVLLRPCALSPSSPRSHFYLCALLWVLLAGSGPAASNFLLLRQKKVTKEKATRSLGPFASLRATCAARLRRGLPRTRPRCQHPHWLHRLLLPAFVQRRRADRERAEWAPCARRASV